MEHGIITATRYEQGVILCDVQPIRVNDEYENIPVMKPFDGFHAVPKMGQKVGMVQLSDDSRFITKIIARNPDGHYPDSMEEGELTIQLDSETKIAFEKNNSGEYDVTLGASGHLQINADSVDIDTTEGS